MALIRRRLCWICALLATILVYLFLVHTVHQVVLQATQHRVIHRRPLSRTSSHTLPVITGYSLELLFRSARRASCSVSPPTQTEVSWNNDVWQKVENSPFYLFSSHWDDRLSVDSRKYSFVRILAMLEGDINVTSDDSLYCQLWRSLETQTPLDVVEATVTEIWIEAWDPNSRNRSYRPYLISCPTKSRVAAVSIVARKPCSRASTLLLVPNEKTQIRQNFGVCVKGLDFPNDISSRLIEWIELNVLLGASHFIFYIFNIHHNISRILDRYERTGLITRVPLTLPGAQPNEPRERSAFLRRNIWQKRRNELVPYNDCFYRLAKTFRFVVPIDVDEVIVPVQHKDWHALIHTLENEDPTLIPSHASLSAQQTYFFDDLHPIQRIEAIPPYMYLLSRIRRTVNFTQTGHGIKSFIVSDNCLTVFNHYAMESLKPGIMRDAILPTRLVQLNHYKPQCPIEVHQDCPYYLSHMTTDRILLRYKDKLVPKVKAVLKELNFI